MKCQDCGKKMIEIGETVTDKRGVILGAQLTWICPNNQCRLAAGKFRPSSKSRGA